MSHLCQARLVNPAEPIASLVAHPPLVYIRVVTRLDAQDARAIVQMRSVEHIMNVHIAPLCAAVADGWSAREVPHACLEPEIAIRQRADRTDVNDVARVRIVEILARIEADLGPIASIEDAEFPGLRDLVRETHAARAQNAALLIEHHVRADRHGLLLLDLLLPEPRIVEPEVHVEVLEITLSRLIADGTIERMVGEQEFKHSPGTVFGFSAFRVHHHSVSDGRVAGDLQLRVLLDFDDADTAVSGNGESGVIAVARDEDPDLLGGLDHGAAV